MSEYIATARVQVLPDLDNFTKNLTTDLNKQIAAFNKTAAAKLTPIQVPVAAGAIGKAQMAGVAAGATQANKALSKTGTSAVVAKTNLDKLNTSAGKSRAALLGAGTATARLDAALLGLRTAVGSTAVIGLGAAALAAIALGKAIRSTFAITVAYERELNTFQAVTGASAAEMERVAAAAKQLGADVTLPAVSAADAAVAMSELAKAGLSVQDAIDGARGVLQLATAANIGFADAVELAASALNAFQLTGKDAVKVADTLANAANLAQGSITDIGLSLQQSAAVGRQAGLTFQDTTAFLTLLARAGLKGSDAGTSLRTALIRLINPTAKAAEIIKDLGVSIRDEAGNIRPDIFIQFANAMRGLTPEARDAKLAILGGQDALRAFAILGRTSTKDFIALRAELRKQGTAADVAAARTKGLGGSMQALQSTLETLGITIGQRVAPGFTDFVNSVTATVSALSQSEGVAAIFSAGMTGVATALNLVGTAASAVGPLLLGFTNLAAGITSAFGSQLVTALLATVVAMKAYSIATKSAIAYTIQFKALLTAEIFRSATVGLTGLTRALVGTRAIVAAAATSFNLWLIGAVALGAGLLYLSTRESATEAATRRLKEATDALAEAQANARSAAEGLASAQRTKETGQLAIEQAKIAEATAKVALASSNAAAGSIERRQLEINLAVATQNVTFATQDYTTAMEGLTAAQEANAYAQAERKRRLEEEQTALLNLTTQTMAQAKQRSRFQPTGLTEAGSINEVISLLNEQAAADARSTDAFVRNIGRRKKLLADIVAITGKIPTERAIEILVKAPNIKSVLKGLEKEFGFAGTKNSKTLAEFFLKELPNSRQKLIQGFRDLLLSVSPESARSGGENANTFWRAWLAATKAKKKQIQDAIKITISPDVKFAAAEARGASDAQLLALAREEQRRAAAAFAKIDAATAGGTKFKGDVQKTNYEKAVARKNAADAQVDALIADIKSTTSAQNAKIEEAARDRDEAAQKLFDVLTGSGKGIRGLNKKLSRAEGTPGLQDDIQFTEQLVNYFKTIQKNLRKRLLEIGASAAVIKELGRAIQDMIDKAAADLVKLRQDNAQALKEAAAQKLDLRIQFFQIKGDVKGEIKARTARLKAITAELARLKNAGKRYTAAWWELRVQQAEEIKAINELKGQTKEKNKAEAGLMFAFLQAQQGFAANLLGNLIGGGMTGGLVGGGSAATAAAPPSVAELVRQERAGILPQEHGRGGAIGAGLVEQGQIAAGTRLGVSRGQGTTQVELLRSILQALNDIKRGAGFPGAHYQRRQASAAHDTGGGGGGVQTA